MTGYKEFSISDDAQLTLKKVKKMGLRMHGTDPGGEVKWQR
jgi:hypothetical protein